MKLVKSLLLGSAAGLMAVAGAQAADLPSRKAAPAAEYVRVCSAYGAGFFFIPGSDTCLQLSGRVRAQYQYGQDGSAGLTAGGSAKRGDNITGFRAMLRFGMDARTQTEYGTVRAVARLSVERRTGYSTTGTGIRAANIIMGNSVDTSGRLQTQVNIEAAFIQFAGITAGRAPSFFNDVIGLDEYHGLAYTGLSSGATNLLAYTASFGGGFSATLSIEDSNERRTGGFGVNTVTGAFTAFGGNLQGQSNGNAVTTFGVPGYSVSQRSRAADIVANLRLDQSWGSVGLSGALVSHQWGAGAPGDKWGYAIAGGARINLPMIGAGSNLQLTGSYGKGAFAYVAGNGWHTAGSGNGTAVNFRKGLSFGQSDFVFGTTGVAGGETVRLSEAWSAMAALQVFWTPRLRSTFGASYYVVTPGYTVIGGNSNARKYNVWNVMGNLIWSPVRGMDIGVEVLYGQGTISGTPVAVNGVNMKKDDAFVARLRLQRDF